MTVRKTKILFLIICTLQLFYLFNFRSGFRYEIIRDSFNENSGISYAVSPEVIESRDILKKYEAIHFNLSKKLKNDVYFYQRSLEFNYPIRINQSSKLVFFSINEDILEKCNVVETGKYLKLTRC